MTEALVTDRLLLLTLRQSAASTGLSVRSLYRLMDAGRLAFVRIGGSRRITPAALQQLIADSTVEATPFGGLRREQV